MLCNFVVHLLKEASFYCITGENIQIMTFSELNYTNHFTSINLIPVFGNDDRWENGSQPNNTTDGEDLRSRTIKTIQLRYSQENIKEACTLAFNPSSFVMYVDVYAAIHYVEQRKRRVFNRAEITRGKFPSTYNKYRHSRTNGKNAIILLNIKFLNHKLLEYLSKLTAIWLTKEGAKLNKKSNTLHNSKVQERTLWATNTIDNLMVVGLSR